MYKSAATALFSVLVSMNSQLERRTPASEMANPSGDPLLIQAAYTPAEKAQAPKKSVTQSGSSGYASVYWEPQRVACGGGRFNPSAMTAAHKTLPCGTKLKVTNPSNGKSVIVTINDRGPYVKGRVLDLSRGAAQKIGFSTGVRKVRFERVR